MFLLNLNEFGDAKFMFKQQDFPFNKTTSGIPHNGAFYYYSSNDGEPLGFSSTKEIYLYAIDIYDCAVLHGNDIYCPPEQMDPLRLSIHSSKFSNFKTGYQAGTYILNFSNLRLLENRTI